MATQQEINRWYPLIEHPVQRKLIDDDVRFKLVPAGRRSGKTERAKRFVVKTAMAKQGNYFICAPTHSQVKRIYWEDLKLLSFSSCFSKPVASELRIDFINGSTITLIGLDKPQRIEGVTWSGGIIDEIADVKPSAWALNIKPALDTYQPNQPDYKAWCWLIGVPDGLNHYYDMVEYANSSKDQDWKVYAWKSSDILPAHVIDAARRTMSLKQFKQEYEASFETATGRVYEDYGKQNLTDRIIASHEPLIWCHDFNYSPLCSCIGVIEGHNIYFLDEIILHSASAKQAALEFVERYKNHNNKRVDIYGDPAGKAGEKHGQASNYLDIEKVLRESGWAVQRKVKAAAPAIRDRQNAVRAKILDARGVPSLFVNPTKAVYCNKGLAITQLVSGSSFQEREGEYQHITTAMGYCIEREFPITIAPSVDKPSIIIPSSKTGFNRGSYAQRQTF